MSGDGPHGLNTIAKQAAVLF